MLIVMEKTATEEQIAAVVKKIEALGYRAHVMPGAQRTAIGITGNPGPLDAGLFEDLPGVIEAVAVSRPYKLVSREIKPEKTVVRVGPVEIGGKEIVIIAGPCAVESYEQTMIIADAVSRLGVKLFRGGAYKPRTSPYSFQGLGVEGLKILADVRARFGLRIVTEAIDRESADWVERYADVMQIGARNMQNFSLLRRAGQARIPVLLKRGPSATLEELLLAAEYILAEGNYNVILCERGVRTFNQYTRNTLDLSIVPAVHRLSHLPILVDPSHGTGQRDKVIPLARAGVAVGADGIMVEVHHQPDRALSDGPQALTLEMFRDLVEQVRHIAAFVREAERAVQWS
jgi:3-deoxy-7-phosphoheptulonate synthase